MSSERRYPEAVAGPFPVPPESFTDAAGRGIDILSYGDGPVADERDRLVEMFATFDPADRAQGIPPATEGNIRAWLDSVLVDEAINVLAWDADRVVGHATLVPDDGGAFELAIFVHQEHQRAGIGSRLIRCLLGEGLAEGVERVWLTVERWNRRAIELYRGVGFETTDAGSFELEMALRIGEDAGT